MWVLTGLMTAMLPLIYSTVTVDITLAPQFFFFNLLLILMGCFFFVQRKNAHIEFGGNPISFSILGYLIFCGISMVDAVNTHEGIFDLLKIINWFFLIVLIAQIIKFDSTFRKVFAFCFSLSGLILALLGLFQLAGWGFLDIPGNVIPYGTLGNRNIYISALVLTLPFSAYFFLCAEKFPSRAFAILAFCMSLLVILFSGMRTAWLAIFVGVIIVLFILISFRKNLIISLNPLMHKALKILFIFLMIASAGFYVFTDSSGTNARNSSSETLNVNSINERRVLWRSSLLMIRDYPINGVGLNNWKIILPDYGLTYLPPEARKAEMHFQRPENDFLWVFAETGIIGGLFYLAIFVFSFIGALRFIQQSVSFADKVFGFTLLFGCVLYTVISFFGFPRERTFLTIEHAFMLASLISVFEPSVKSIRRFKIHSLVFCTFSALGLIAAFRVYEGERQTARIIEARLLNHQKDVIDFGNRALASGYSMDPTSTPIAFYLGVAEFSQNNVTEATVWFEKAYQLNPNHLHVLNNLATCRSIQGKNNEALDLLLRVLEISPDFQEAIINLSAHYYSTNNYNRACYYFFRARKDNQSPLYQQLDQLISGRKNKSLLFIVRTYLSRGDWENADRYLKRLRYAYKEPTYKELRNAVLRLQKSKAPLTNKK